MGKKSPYADSGGDEGQDLFAHIEFNQWSSDEHDGKLKREVKVVNRSFPIPEWPLTLDDLKNPSLCQMTENVVEYFNPLCTGRLLCLYYTAKNFEDHGIKASADDKGKRQETWYDILTLWMKIFCNSSGDCNAIRAKLKREVNKFKTMKKCYNVRGSSKAKEVLWKYLDSTCTIPQSRVMTVDSIRRQNPAEAVDSLTKTEPSSCSHKEIKKLAKSNNQQEPEAESEPEEEYRKIPEKVNFQENRLSNKTAKNDSSSDDQGDGELTDSSNQKKLKIKLEPEEEDNEIPKGINFGENWLSYEIKTEKDENPSEQEDLRSSTAEVNCSRIQNKSNTSDKNEAHAQGKSYQCEICNREFARSASLKDHMTIHANKKPHQCHVCNKPFSQALTLNDHILKLHTDEKPYDCIFCSKSFKRSFFLTAHLNLHTGENKNHSCEICNKAFVTPGILRKHELGHAKRKLSKYELKISKLLENQNNQC